MKGHSMTSVIWNRKQ